MTDRDKGAFDVEKFVGIFAAIAEANGGTKHLRNLVLDLAVHGQLVERDDDEEQSPGGQSPLPSGSPPTSAPFMVPSSWRWRSGREVFSFVTSGSRGWAKYYSDKGAVFLRIGNLDYDAIDLDLRDIQRVSPPRDAEGTRTRVQPGDVLISITGDTGMVGLVPDDLGEAYINQHIALSRPASHVLPKFVARALTAPSILAAVQGAQRGIKNSLGLDDIRNVMIPIPPLAEQKRIVAKVDELMRMLDDLEAKQTKKREIQVRLRSAALGALTSAEAPEEFDAAWKRVAENFEVFFYQRGSVAMLRTLVRDLAVMGQLVPRSSKQQNGKTSATPDGPFQLPSGWRWVCLGDICVRTDYGTSQKAHLQERGIPVLRMNNIQDGKLELESLKYVPADTDGLEGLLLAPGDLLFNRTNSYELVGKMAVFREVRSYTFASYLIRVQLLDEAIPEYVNIYFGSKVCREMQIEPHITRQTNQANFNGTKLKQIEIPLPPLEVQERIVAKVEQLMKLCDDLDAKLQRSEATASKLVEAVVAEMVA